jgi:hypothetical protein
MPKRKHARNQHAEAQHSHFLVGVETEAPLAVRAPRETSEPVLLGNTEAMDELARRFNASGLVAYADGVDAGRDHSKWGITLDTSIEVGRELEGWLHIS